MVGLIFCLLTPKLLDFLCDLSSDTHPLTHGHVGAPYKDTRVHFLLRVKVNRNLSDLTIWHPLDERFYSFIHSSCVMARSLEGHETVCRSESSCL